MRTEIKRETKETKIFLELEYPGDVRAVKTECGFLSHMLDLMCHRSGLGAKLTAAGDIEVDYHHLTEDIGIAFGQCLREIARAEPRNRYGWCLLPMDGSLASVALDFSGRGGCYFKGGFPNEKCGGFDLELIPEFFSAMARESGITLHIEVLAADNSHHTAEAVFKGVGMALGQALRPATLNPSTKGLWL